MKTKKQLSNIAHKAVATRRARDEFYKQNMLAYLVADLTAQKVPSFKIAEHLWLTNRQVAAYKANLTRGTYGDLLDKCNF